jgi:hypothetical protein
VRQITVVESNRSMRFLLTSLAWLVAISTACNILPPRYNDPALRVASVDVEPPSASAVVGDTTTFKAVTKDAQANMLDVRAVEWSSSNTDVAIVDSLGHTTAVGIGSCELRATVNGVTGTAFAVVVGPTDPLPPPPPPQGQPPAGAWPNLPSGFRTLADQSFNAPLSGLWSLIWNDLGLGGLSTDAGAPFSPSGVMQFRYPSGFPAGESPGTVLIKLGGQRRLYVGLWWKASANWQGHDSHVNKIQFLFPPDGNGDIYMAAYGPPGGPYDLTVNLQLVNADTRNWLKPNVGGGGNGRVTMGEWHRIEWLVDYGTEGVHNGTMRWWLDGKLVGDYRDILYPVLKLDNYKVAPTWGGMGGSKTQTDYYWYDHVYVARP